MKILAVSLPDGMITQAAAVDTKMRKHIEGFIGWNLRNNHHEWKALYPDDNHVGAEAAKDHGELKITAPVLIRG